MAVIVSEAKYLSHQRNISFKQVTNPNQFVILSMCEERTSKGTETKHGQSSVPFLNYK